MPRNDADSAGSPRYGALLLLRPAVWLLHCLLGRPRDSALAIVVASAVCAIVINSLFLQRGPHPAPIFAHMPPERPRDIIARRTSDDLQVIPMQRQATAEEPTGAVAPALPRQRPAEAPPKPQAGRANPAHKDAIAEILAPSQQMIGVQRALSNFGYGQITPNGSAGPETRAAIERFERERRMPVTGQVSDRLVRELTAMTGKPL